MSFIPGMQQVAGLAQFFVELSLGYVDECCLGYTFYQKEQGAFKSAADGVVIYAQNWKTLLGSAAKTMLMVILGLLGITLVLFLLLALLFRAFDWPGWVAFVIALLIALAIKYAFMDSFILARTMAAYMGVAPTTVITFDLYGKLCNLSSKFKELFNKGQKEEPSAQASYTPPAGDYAYTAQEPAYNSEAQENVPDYIFCGQCGSKNERGTKFCGSCGSKLS